MTDAKTQIADGERFGFGRNWRGFVSKVRADQMLRAESALAQMLGTKDLTNRTFLDVGCGSGLSSLAARRLGAKVRAFDFDPESVEASRSLRDRERPDDPEWYVSVASILDEVTMSTLPPSDVVYAWGVLHHTGAMWRAVDAATKKVASGGVLFLALYNDQGWLSDYWRAVKRVYNLGAPGRALAVLVHAPYLFLGRWFVRLITGRRRIERGMSLWHDMLDWLGGYPFEVASPESVIAFCNARGLEVRTIVTCGRRHGCNEFVFQRIADASVSRAG